MRLLSKNQLNILFLFIICLPSVVSACPRVDGFWINYNCDEQQRFSVAFLGDSIVNGVGDTRNGNRGGYPLRLRKFEPNIEIRDIGVNGITSRRLLRDFKRNINKNKAGVTQQKTRNLDAIVIAVAPNDYWEDISPARTVTNIKRLVKFIRKNLGVEQQTPPFIVIATPTPNLRSFQRPFILDVRKKLLKMRSKNLPVHLRLDKIRPSVISLDGLHPTSRGYRVIAKFVQKFLRNKLQILMAKNRADIDVDGIYDNFETDRYFTDPDTQDTDGDGIQDGTEVFVHTTDPALFDTDGDGSHDGLEIQNGTDPLDPASL